jgi:acetylornithine deacetylase/succinyl-diaminopimelate desuccinylase-like protein
MDFGVVFESWRVLLPGILMTIQVSVLVIIVGSIGGLCGGLCLLFGSRPLRLLVRAYVDVVRGLAAKDPNLRAEVRVGLSRAPFEVSMDQPIVQLLQNRAAAAMGRTPSPIGESGWMDSALLSSAGIPTVIFGPRGEGAHSAVEWVDLNDLDQCRKIYVDTAREFCG